MREEKWEGAAGPSRTKAISRTLMESLGERWLMNAMVKIWLLINDGPIWVSFFPVMCTPVIEAKLAGRNGGR